MKYISSRGNFEKDLSEDILTEVRQHILAEFPEGIKEDTMYGEIQDALLSFRRKNGGRLLLNQLAPIYLRLCWGEAI